MGGDRFGSPADLLVCSPENGWGPPANGGPRLESHLVNHAGRPVESPDAPTNATPDCSVSEMFVK
jgi:hypothetical protein